MAVIDIANAFFMRPKAGSAPQSSSNILDFGAGTRGGKNNPGGYLNLVTISPSSGSVVLQESDNGVDGWTTVPGSTIQANIPGSYSIKLPKHKRFVRASLTTLTPSNTDVFIGGLIDESLI